MSESGAMQILPTRGIPGLIKAEADHGRVLRLAFMPRFSSWGNVLFFVVFPPLLVVFLIESGKPKPVVVQVNGQEVVFPARLSEGEKNKIPESKGLAYLVYAGYAFIAFIVLHDFRRQWVFLHVEAGKGIWKRCLLGKPQSCAGAHFLGLESRYGKTHSVRVAQTYAGIYAVMPDEEIIELIYIFDYCEINLSQTMRQLLINAGFNHDTTTPIP